MFHVPHAHRIRNGPMASNDTAGNNGAFLVPPLISGRDLWIIASDGYDWEHVSVHAANHRDKLYTPNWDEMCYCKKMFWDIEDVVMQLHPAQSEWITNHTHTLHLWRPTTVAIPTPPGILVGLKSVGVLR